MNPFLAEIRIFAGNFPPIGWATCDGQILPISQNTALFSLLGTYYGGDGKSTFGLPNLQGRVPIHAGGSGGPGLTPRVTGESGGSPTVTLLQSELPIHGHALRASNAPGPLSGPAGNLLAQSAAGSALYNGSPNTPMHPASLDPAGGGQPHNNMQPYQTLTYIIALQGVYPARSTPQAAPSAGKQGGSTRG